jgi:hypothetical protein
MKPIALLAQLAPLSRKKRNPSDPMSAISSPQSRRVDAESGLLSSLWRSHTSIAIGAVVLISLWVTVAAISRSYLIGKLAFPSTHNDVNYLIDGIRSFLYVELNGFWAELYNLYHQGFMHGPLSGLQAALGFALFGFHDWAPYATNIVYLLVFFGVSVGLLRGTSDVAVVAILLAMAGMPLLVSSISEFAPEIPCGLFTALGVLLVTRIHALNFDVRSRCLAGICLGLGFLAKPSSLIFVPLVTCASLGIVVIRDVLIPGHFKCLGRAVYLFALQMALSLWLPLLYVIPFWDHYSNYFYLAMFDPTNVKAFGGSGTPWTQDPWYYLTGAAAEYMFGDFLWAYIGLIGLGVVAALWRGDWKFVARQFELSLMVVFMWIPPTASLAKNTLFGAPFGYLLAFMVVIALRSIYETMNRAAGATAVSLLSFFLLVSPTSRYALDHTPGFYWRHPNAHIVTQKWVDAMHRFTAVILGNSPIYHSGTVYIPNPGYYHVPVLWYAFLKTDPTLQWSFNSFWEDSDPKYHVDYIKKTKQDFVIVGAHGNGLTYSPSLIAGSEAAGDGILAALWKDPDYTPIDKFYGPGGGTITVFQRAVQYAGWHPMQGLQDGGSLKPWFSTARIVYIQSYAPTSVPASLMISATGAVGQSMEVIINGRQSGDMVFDSSNKASLNLSVNLVAGENDIVLKRSSDSTVAFDRLLVTRKIAPDS